MDYLEESDHAFIIRIWKEKREIESAPPVWRGVIEHAATGKKRYLQDLAHILTFITPYLEEMGLKTTIFWRWTLRLKNLHLSSSPRPSTTIQESDDQLQE
jgi:hypothetical protein